MQAETAGQAQERSSSPTEGARKQGKRERKKASAACSSYMTTKHEREASDRAEREIRKTDGRGSPSPSPLTGQDRQSFLTRNCMHCLCLCLYLMLILDSEH